MVRGFRQLNGSTREADQEALVGLVTRRLDRMLELGTTTAEAKSGYGLNVEDELKFLAETAGRGA